jgi:hypothetical protein
MSIQSRRFSHQELELSRECAGTGLRQVFRSASIAWLVAGGVASTLHGADTAWLSPVAGSFNDRLMWSHGVPGLGDNAIFGTTSGVPFVVTVDGPTAIAGLRVISQSPTLKGSAGTILTVVSDWTVAGTNGSTLTLEDIEVTSFAPATLIGAGGMGGNLVLGDGADVTLGRFLIGSPGFGSVTLHDGRYGTARRVSSPRSSVPAERA